MIDSRNWDLRSQPAHAEMVEDILAGIGDGTLAVGHRLASEAMLKQQYGISYNSIKRGLGTLVEQGILTRRRGSGTYVAGTDISPQMLVRRDTIAIARSWEYWRYHPFFSEQQRGIQAGLARHGWKVFDVQHDIGARPHNGHEISYRHLSPEMVKLELEQHSEIAGVICTQGSEQVAAAISGNGTVVVNTGSARIEPYVTYDWAAETERLFRIALGKGARSLVTIGSLEKEDLTAMSRRAAAGIGLAAGDVTLTCLHCDSSHSGSPLVAGAYQLALDAFNADHGFDGLIITGDYEATGVTDALVSLPPERWRDMHVLALLNKESKLHARIPMTALVADGYACGRALADMMHKHVSNGGDCSSGITLSCDQVEWR